MYQLLTEKLLEITSLDYRSLALVRILSGILILLDLYNRAESLGAHYSDIGVLPRNVLLTEWNNYWFISLHMASGMVWFQGALFILAGIAALMLIIGYNTTLASIVSWILLISLQSRNPLVLQGGDIVFRLTLFWLIFLPTAKVWSLDRLLGKTTPPKEQTWFGVAGIGYLVQIICIYLFTGLLKDGASWHITHTAVYEALSLDQLVRPLGVWLRSQPHSLLAFLTQCTLYLEIYGPLLFLIPWRNAFFRTTGILLFIALQVGFDTSLRVGLFGAIMTAATIGLLPSVFWDITLKRISQRLSSRSWPGLSIYYDSDCGFCTKMITLCKDTLCLSADTTYVPLSNNTTFNELSRTHNSWVVVENSDTIHLAWEGVLVVLKHSFVFRPLWWIAKMIPKRYGEWIYRTISTRRTTVCIPENEEAPKVKTTILAFVRDLFLCIVIICTVSWNIASLPHQKQIIHEKIETAGWILRLDQRFDMFAPTPLRDDGWYVFEGKLQNKTTIDPYHNKPIVSFEKPKNLAFEYQDQRWQKYLMNLSSNDFKPFRGAYADYLCRSFNEPQKNPALQMTGLTIYFIKERTIPTGGTEPTTQEVVWSGECGK